MRINRQQTRQRSAAWWPIAAAACACALAWPALVRADGDPNELEAPAAGVRSGVARGKAARAPMAANAPAGKSPVKPAGADKAAVVSGMDTTMTLDLRQASVATALRLISEVAQVNIVSTQAASDRELTLYLSRTTAKAALDAVTRAAGLWVRWREASGSYMIMTAEEYQRDLTVFGEERTEVLHLRHHNVLSAASALRAMFGTRVRLQAPNEEPLGEAMKVTEPRRSAAGINANATGQAQRAAGSGTPGAEAQNTRGGARQSLGPDAAQLGAAAADAGGTFAQVEAAQQGNEAPIFVTYNRLHNLLVLRSGDERALAQAKSMIAQLDLPVRQVLLEMRIIQVRLDDEFHRALDMDFFSKATAKGVATTASPHPVNPLTGATTGPKITGTMGGAELFDKNTGLFQYVSNRIRVRLQLLEQQGRVQTLARPLLLASNNEPARLFIGEEVVLTTGATSQTTTGTTGATNTTITVETEKRNIGTTLVIHPRINEDRSVTLTIDQENSERVVGGTTIPLPTGTMGDGVIQFPIDTVNAASIQVVAQAKDGLTIALGGMIKINKSKTAGNVPGLSKVPLLGELFKRDQQVDDRSELVLVLTPHVLESAEEAERVSANLRDATGPELLGSSAEVRKSPAP